MKPISEMLAATCGFFAYLCIFLALFACFSFPLNYLLAGSWFAAFIALAFVVDKNRVLLRVLGWESDNTHRGWRVNLSKAEREKIYSELRQIRKG